MVAATEWVNPLNVPEMLAQERSDYADACRVFASILKGREYSLEPMPPLTVWDVTLNVGGKTFLVELKFRDQSLSYGTFPILASKREKLLKAMREQQADGILYVVFNRGRYTLYRLDKINLNDCIVRLWDIKKYEMSDDDHREPQLTVFLPFALACCEGDIPN